MTSIIERRVSLHKHLANEQQENKDLRSHISKLQALANIGTTTYMIAHEINNLLAPLASYAALALKNPDEKGLAEKALQKVVTNCEHSLKIMDSMLGVVNGETQAKQNSRLISLVEEVFTCLCRDFAKDGISVQIGIAEDLTVWAVPVQIQQVLMNLILNAREAMLPRGGILTIKAQDISDAVQIEVSDSGCGIGPEDLKNIFETLFTTKAKKCSSGRAGCGLGLAFCKQIVDAHGGCILVESKPGEGTTFKITLPKPQ